MLELAVPALPTGHPFGATPNSCASLEMFAAKVAR